MKSRFIRWPALLLAGSGLIIAFTSRVAAQETPTATAVNGAANANANPAPAVKLSYGVPEVLKLVKAKISDGTVVSFIQNSGTVYSLSAAEIVYLHGQGVSDRVLSAMLDAHRNVTASTAATQATAAPAQAPATYAEAPPAYTPAVSTYVIPYSPPAYYDYSWPYYDYWWYPYPAFSFSFGLGGFRGGGFHDGGFRGGGFHGGGAHGGRR
jgi:uncharacterized membrane protein YgcG